MRAAAPAQPALAAAAMQNVHYLKTAAGQSEMVAGAPALNPRERQIMLLCTAQRPLSVLVELFGDGVVRELHALVERGLLQASYHAAALTLRVPPVPESDSQSAARLAQARDFATQVAGSLGTAQASALMARHRNDREAEDVLHYLGEVVGLVFARGQPGQALSVGYQLAALLPRSLVPMLIDQLLSGANPQLADALYAHLLGEGELPAREGLPSR